MIDNGICRESKLPWASNVVLVEKRDGSLRFAINYRGLNGVTKKDAYSLPNPQHILDKLHGARYFTSLDVASAYWCVPVSEAEIEKTAFYTPRGQYEMLVMPFGLCNSQATYQRLMDHTLTGLEFVESFVDDSLIFSRTFREHMEHVKEVLLRLRYAGIQLRSEKCRFGYTEIDFLGHHITSEGRMSTKTSVELLLKFPRPNSLGELQSFLVSVNFYRAYIPRIAQVAQPLYTLTQKGTPWIWDSDCESAFQELRQKLVKEPVKLAFPKWGEELYIESDVSSKGIAAVLSQKDESTGVLRPISYFSSVLTATQMNYSAGQLEAWALLAASRKWDSSEDSTKSQPDHGSMSTAVDEKAERSPTPLCSVAHGTRDDTLYHNLPARILQSRSGLLNRVPDLEVDSEVNEECVFEDKIYQAEDGWTNGDEAVWIERIAEEQLKDTIVSEAKDQLSKTGRIQRGQLKNVSVHLNLRGGESSTLIIEESY